MTKHKKTSHQEKKNKGTKTAPDGADDKMMDSD